MHATAEGPPVRNRVGALDGIRAFAVLAVIASHTPGTGLPGGYFGVDVFFALSGYLITALLIAEFRRHETISITTFWARRARRLLPALLVLLIVIGVAAALLPRAFAGTGLRGDAVSTMFYFANWHLIWEHANYFVASGNASPLQHTWSLAIEEQFYLLWPFVVLGVLRVGRGWNASRTGPGDTGVRLRLKVLLSISVFGALLSAIWMAVVTKDPFDTVRSYYGSDTRAQSLLIGAALATGLALWRPPATDRSRRALSSAAVVSSIGIALLWLLVPDTSPIAFNGGFAIAAVGTSVIIACAVEAPDARVLGLLRSRPLRFLGEISYGMYLWYWPTVLILSPAHVHVAGFVLFGERLLVATVLAAISAFAIELPIRRGELFAHRLLVTAPIALGVSCISIFSAAALPGLASVSSAPSGKAVLDTAAASMHGPPIKILLVGDSMAGSMGVGMSEVAGRYGAVIANEGTPGCSLSMDKAIRSLWFTAQPGPPCNPLDDQALFHAWRNWIRDWNPDAVVYLARGEVLDQQIGNSTSWTHIGQTTFDVRLAQRFDEGIKILRSRGAPVFLLGSPLYDSALGAATGSSPPEEDDPARVTIDDALMRIAAGQNPGSGFVDVGSWVSPNAHYATSVQGVTLRCGDGVHFTAAGGQWVAERLLPALLQAARQHHSASPGGTWPGSSLPKPVPGWYPSLDC